MLETPVIRQELYRQRCLPSPTLLEQRSGESMVVIPGSTGHDLQRPVCATVSVDGEGLASRKRG